VHICYGYGIKANTDWKASLGSQWRQYEESFPLLQRSSIDIISLECQHSHVPMELIELVRGKKVMLGAIDVADETVETPEEVADTLRRPRVRRRGQAHPEHQLRDGALPAGVALHKLSALSAGAPSSVTNSRSPPGGGDRACGCADRRGGPPRLRSSLSADEFKALFRGHPGGVAVITADAGDGPVALTATSVVSVSAEPPLLIFSISALSSSSDALSAETVVVHLLDANDIEVAKLGAARGSTASRRRRAGRGSRRGARVRRRTRLGALLRHRSHGCRDIHRHRGARARERLRA
jgi:hypothetical protein